MANSFLTELKRRNVFKVGVAYLVLAWVVIQIADVIVPALSLPDWTITFLVVVGMFGFPFAIFFAWAFEITPEGIKKESDIAPGESKTAHTGRKLDFTIIGLLVIALSYFIYESRIDTVSEELSNTQGNVTQEEKPSIAVLPFVNMSSDMEQEYFSDGLSEELLNLLAKIPQLRVIARTSSFSFKGKQDDVSSIAKKLNVAFVLEGSVRKSGNTLRITAQLIRSSDSSHLWSETYDRELINIFSVQDEIAKAVVNVLKVKLIPNQNTSTTNSVDPEAYNQYLLGANFNRQSKSGSWRLAKKALEKSLSISPNYAPANVEMAESLLFISEGVKGTEELDAARAEAQSFADKAISLDPNLADGYRIRSYISIYTYDFVNALADIQKAQQITHGDSKNLSTFGLLLWNSGQYEEAIKVLNEAIELDPLSAASMIRLGDVYISTNQNEKAETILLQALQISPRHTFGQVALAVNHLLNDKYDDAINLYSNQDGMWSKYISTMAYFSKGNSELSEQYLKELIDKHSQTAAYQIAAVYAWRGEIDLAFKWIETAYQQHDAGMSIIKADNILGAKFKSDPRYGEWLIKMGLSD